MNRLKEMYYDFIDIMNYKSQIRLLKKQVEELKAEPQKLIDKMNLMKLEIRELKYTNKELEKELKKYVHNE